MSYSFRMGASTIRKIVYSTCELIWERLQPKLLPEPKMHHWLQSAKEFEQRWQYPNCIGALDSKHCVLECPPNSGSLNFNYKHSYSKVLLAICDAFYRFMWVDIGRSGANSDSGLFRCTTFGCRLLNGYVKGLPPSRKLCTSGPEQNFVLVADEAFKLTPIVMRPYSSRVKHLTARKRIFNLRLSRARHVVESAFGILASRFRFLRCALKILPHNFNKLIQASVVLHNFLMSEKLIEGRSEDSRL